MADNSWRMVEPRKVSIRIVLETHIQQSGPGMFGLGAGCGSVQ